MGEITDIGDLLGKAMREKRARLLWAIGTAVFTCFSTTVTVTWKMRGMVDDLERANEKMRGDILVMAKAVESVQGLQKDIQEAQKTADKAMLYAQLAYSNKPGEKQR
jgi:hypothetical protein